MRNEGAWIPTKYVYEKGRLTASDDRQEVGVGSWLMADRVAGRYDRHLVEFARGRLVDLGCGKVPLYASYRDYVASCTCVDRQKSEVANEFLDVACDLSQMLPFASGSFDTVILSDVLEHIPEPTLLWKEMSRILTPEGSVLMNTPFYYKLHAQPYDYFGYTAFVLCRFAESSGFAVRVLTPVGGSPEIFADLLAKHLVYLPLIGNFMAGMVQRVAHAFVGTRLGSRVSTKTADHFPLGYFLVAQKVAP